MIYIVLIIIIIIILLLLLLQLDYYTYTKSSYKTHRIKKNDIIFDTVIELAKNCNNMYGEDKLLPHQYSLMCYSDEEIEDKIIEKLIRNKKDKYNLIFRLKKDLKLKEKVIYPLKNTGKYTIHGLQYFTKDMANINVL